MGPQCGLAVHRVGLVWRRWVRRCTAASAGALRPAGAVPQLPVAATQSDGGGGGATLPVARTRRWALLRATAPGCTAGCAPTLNTLRWAACVWARVLRPGSLAGLARQEAGGSGASWRHLVCMTSGAAAQRAGRHETGPCSQVSELHKAGGGQGVTRRHVNKVGGGGGLGEGQARPAGPVGIGCQGPGVGRAPQAA